MSRPSHLTSRLQAEVFVLGAKVGADLQQSSNRKHTIRSIVYHEGGTFKEEGVGRASADADSLGNWRSQ